MKAVVLRDCLGKAAEEEAAEVAEVVAVMVAGTQLHRLRVTGKAAVADEVEEVLVAQSSVADSRRHSAKGETGVSR